MAVLSQLGLLQYYEEFRAVAPEVFGLESGLKQVVLDKMLVGPAVEHPHHYCSVEG